MLMYGIAIKPLILKLQTPRTIQMWFAGNGNAAGSLFENLSNQRPSFCYYVYAPECQLIVKPLTEQKADNFVSNNKVQTLNGRMFSDQFFGSDEDMQNFSLLKHKADDYTKTIQKFSTVGKSSPHAAYHCYFQNHI